MYQSDGKGQNRQDKDRFMASFFSVWLVQPALLSLFWRLFTGQNTTTDDVVLLCERMSKDADMRGSLFLDASSQLMDSSPGLHNRVHCA